ncbi:MAG TPA: AI-2E family transporter, partial [Chthoniobacterales bacterium]|nr:AI-2E family transporter [Chthoniobacterales bacterium]
MSTYPTPWQKRTMWAALSAFFVVLLIVIAGVVIYVGANLISFLQPILIPVAIAIILAYLLDPLLTLLCRRGMGRTWAIIVIFLSVFIALFGLFWWVVPTISVQSANFAKELPSYTQTARDRIVDLVVRYNRTFGGTTGTRARSATSGLVNLLLGTPPPRSATPTPMPSPSASPTGSAAVESIAPAPPKISSAERQKVEADVEKMIVYVQHQ